MYDIYENIDMCVCMCVNECQCLNNIDCNNAEKLRSNAAQQSFREQNSN